MFARTSRHLAAASLLCLLSLLAAPAGATITVSGGYGQVTPADPSLWTWWDDVCIGHNTGQWGVWGILTVSGGSRVPSYTATLGRDANSSGAVTIADPGSEWNIRDALIVGQSGTGTLTISNGGYVSNSGMPGCQVGASAGSAGMVTVDGTGSTWDNSSGSLTLGQEGAGYLTVSNGGKVNSFCAYLGSGKGSTGVAAVTGTGSTWTSDALYVSPAGRGTLTVDNGGTVTTGTLYASFGDLAGTGTINTRGLVADYIDLLFDATHGKSQVIEFGDGGALNLNASGNALGAGYRHTGTMRIADGVKIASYSGYLGYCAGAKGTATITGPGSTWTVSDSLYVGYGGTGTLTVDNGGTLTTVGLYASASNLKGNGTINTKTLFGDMDLVYDATHAPGQAFSFGTGGVLNLNLDTSSYLGVGYKGTGTLRIADGVKVTTCEGYLGSTSTSSGAATVTGPGSAWINCGDVIVGNSGTGTLRVADAGQVSSYDEVYLGKQTNSHGTATVTGPASTLASSSALYVGYWGTGSLRVDKGGAVRSSEGIFGYGDGSSGTGIVTGAGSTWKLSYDLYVGVTGAGSLRVENGGAVTVDGGGEVSYVASGAGSSGTVTVTGMGAALTVWDALHVGNYGHGTLTVGNGGKVTAVSLAVGLVPGGNTTSAVNLHVSGDGMLTVGAGTTPGSVANAGKINFFADAFLPEGTYSPITPGSAAAITWSGTGAYNGFGGAWDSTVHTFTVAAAASSGAGVSNVLTSGERLLITDSATLRRVGASFGTVAGGTNFSAVPLGGADLIGLPADQCLLGAWSFTSNFAGDQALLSFDVGAGQSYDMSVWHYNGTSWAPFAAPDLTYGEDGIADFAVTSLGGGYALIAAAHDGDTNYDNAVNVIDLGVLAKYYDTAAGATWATADFSGDGAVNVVDLGVLAKNYDWSGSWAGTVPEPCSVALLALGGFGLLRRRAR